MMDFFASFQEIGSLLQEINPLSITVRLLLATVIGFVIGVDRGRKRRPAGVKTHVMVCIGSAMVMIISQYISQNLGYGGDIGRMGEVIACIKSTNCKIVNLTIGKVRYSGLKGASIQASILLNDNAEHGEVMASIGGVKGVRLIEETNGA